MSALLREPHREHELALQQEKGGHNLTRQDLEAHRREREGLLQTVSKLERERVCHFASIRRHILMLDHLG